MNLTNGVCLLFCAPMICSDLNHPRRHRFQTPRGFSRFVTGRPSSAKVRSIPSVPPCFSGRRPRNWYHSRRSVKGELRTLVELTCPLIQSRNGYPPSTSEPLHVTWSCASPVHSSPPATEPGWFEDVEAERRRGCDGVYGIFFHGGPDIFTGTLTLGYRRGWEPGAILNWLVLAGWGTQHNHSDHSDGSSSPSKAAPNSATVMTLQEMIQEVGSCVFLPSASALPSRIV